MSSTITEIIVRPTEIDMLGHVNNAKYLEYLEWGREDWYNHAQISFNQMKKQGCATVTVRIIIDYLHEVRLGEQITVHTTPLRKGRSSFVLLQEICNEQNQMVTKAEVTIVVISLAERKSVPLPEQFKRCFP